MSLILQQIFALIKLLNSERGTNPIAAGIALGLILGFSPLLSLQGLLVLLILLFFRVQIGAALVAAFFFKFIAYLFDPLTDALGQWALEIESLRPLYTELYNMPIVPFTRFNNSVVMGSGLLAILLAPIVFFAAQYLISKYRLHIVSRFQKTKFWKVVQATGFYKWYAKYEQLRS